MLKQMPFNFAFMKSTSTPFLAFILIAIAFTGCIKDDLVEDKIEPTLRLNSALETLAQGESHDFDAIYLNEVGTPEEVQIDWASSDVNVATVDPNGVVTALNFGTVEISATHDELVASDSFEVTETTEMEDLSRSGSIQTTSTYLLQGDFTLEDNGAGLTLSFASNYQASTSLPGLFIYLTNNPNTTMGAYEIGAVQTFNGSHSYSIPASVGINDYSHVLYFCAPFNVKVGDGAIN